MRTIPTAIETLILADETQPIELYELYLNELNPTEVTRLCAHISNITFGTDVYVAIGLKRSPIEMNADLTIDNVGGELDNVDKTFVTSLANVEFNNKRVVIKKVLLNKLESSDNYVLLFDGKMSDPVFDNYSFKISVMNYLNILTLQTPRRLFHTLCNYRLGDEWCTVVKTTMPTNCRSSVANAGDESTLVDSWIGTNVDSPLDYWRLGEVVMLTGGNAGLVRPVNTSIATNGTGYLSLRMPFPTTINSGDSYRVYRGCGKTNTECNCKFDNLVNFGGFWTIPRYPLL